MSKTLLPASNRDNIRPLRWFRLHLKDQASDTRNRLLAGAVICEDSERSQKPCRAARKGVQWTAGDRRALTRKGRKEPK